jgi:hypothetical protein
MTEFFANQSGKTQGAGSLLVRVGWRKVAQVESYEVETV